MSEPLQPVVLREVTLGPGHAPTGATRHYGGNELLPTPARLEIVTYAGSNDPGFYLLYLDAAGNWQTDTYHESIDAALAQAQFEFQLTPDEWRVVND